MFKHDIYNPLNLGVSRVWQKIWSCFVGLQTLSLTYKITIYRNYSKENQKGAISRKSESQERELSHLAMESHFQALSEDMFKLLDDTSSCDVKITCDRKTFYAHKNVLGARSPVLLAMLKSNMVEGETGVVNIEDVESCSFECFLRYLYSGKLPELTMENAVALYRVGDKYAVEKLMLACSEFMTQNLSESNACDMLVLADLHSDKDFCRKVISYIIDKRMPQRHKKWSDFCKCHMNLANEVFSLYIEKHCPL